MPSLLLQTALKTIRVAYVQSKSKEMQILKIEPASLSKVPATLLGTRQEFGNISLKHERNMNISKLCLIPFLAIAFAIPLNAQKYINISTDNTSIVLQVDEKGAVNMVHYGGKVDGASDFEGFLTYADRNIHSHMPAYSTQGGDYIGPVALAATYPDGELNTELRFVESSLSEVKPGVQKIIIRLKDAKQPVDVDLVYTVYEKEDVIESHSEIHNRSPKEILLRNYMSNTMCLRANKYLLTKFHGGWGNEMQIERINVPYGTMTIESACGIRTTHKTNPSFMLSLDSDAFSETSGAVVAGALKWSGNYKIEFHRDEKDRLLINSGINPYSSEWHLGKGESFVTPDMVYTFSSRGAGQASRNLHDWARNFSMYDSRVIAPTLLNSWEGVHFDFNMKTLTDMVDDAAEMGLEMFVLDDGWFGNGEFARNSAESGLGDWQVNTVKLSEGLKYLSDYVHSKGMKFGIWIEPEMVNPKSNLFRNHPEWVASEPGREQILRRDQLVLDLSDKKVQDFIYEVFDSLLKSCKADYVKWDCNRYILNPHSNAQEHQSHFYTANTLGLYDVLRRIREAYPDVLIQSCASGGGRVDYGILEYANEVWPSDDTDASVRTRMQYAYSMIYPSCIIASHISAVPNHQTGNVTGIKYRCDVAASGRLGLELQPKNMTEEERKIVKSAVSEYKMFRDIIFYGDLYRLYSPFDNSCSSIVYVSKDKKSAVLFVYNLRFVGRNYSPLVRLNGLDIGLSYKITELGTDIIHFWGNGKCFSADYLQNVGINLNVQKQSLSNVFLLKAE